MLFYFCCIDVISIPGVHHTYDDITLILCDGMTVIPLRKNRELKELFGKAKYCADTQ